MEKIEFDRKDGSKGYNYKAQAGDKVVALADKVFVRENPAIVKGKAVIIKNSGLQVKTATGEEVFLTLTDGQRKVLSKSEPLTGKEIVFEEYENDYGKQVGARVVKK